MERVRGKRRGRESSQVEKTKREMSINICTLRLRTTGGTCTCREREGGRGTREFPL